MLKVKAKEAFDKGEIPVSAVVLDKNQNVISCCCNDRQGSNNLLGHAEVLAILAAEECIGDWRLNGYSMVVNLEPCTMCSAIIKESRLDIVYFFVSKPDNDNVIGINSVYVEGYEDDRDYFRKLLMEFFDNMR